MTPEGAIRIIVDYMETCEQKGEWCFGEIMESLKTAISSLEKQIPKKPIRYNDRGWHFCPNCLRRRERRSHSKRYLDV